MRTVHQSGGDLFLPPLHGFHQAAADLVPDRLILLDPVGLAAPFIAPGSRLTAAGLCRIGSFVCRRVICCPQGW